MHTCLQLHNTRSKKNLTTVTHWAILSTNYDKFNCRPKSQVIAKAGTLGDYRKSPANFIASFWHVRYLQF